MISLSLFYVEEESGYHPFKETNKQTNKKQKKQQKKTSHPPFHTITEDTIRYNIAQMTPTSKGHIPFLLATIIE